MVIDNHLEIISMCYIFFAILAIVSIIINVAKSHKLSIMSMCSVMYIATLFVVPAIILGGYVNGLAYPSGVSFEERDLWTFYTQLALTGIGYLVFHFGYRIKQKKGKTHKVTNDQRILLTSVIFSLVSIVSLFFWASGYGGVSDLVINANQIRAGRLISKNSYTFFKHFVPLSLFASWMLFNMLIRKEFKNKYKKFLGAILLLCDVVLSTVYIQANDGRLLLAVFILLFFLIYLKYQYEIKEAHTTSMMLRVGIILLVAVFILFNADTILSIMRDETTVGFESFEIIQKIAGEFSFLLSGTQRALYQYTSVDFKMMIGNDVINGLFAWLPTSAKPIILEDVWDYNTGLLWTGRYGQSPTSIVAQSVYDLGIAGIIVIPFLYGMLIKRIEIILENRKGIIFYDTVYLVLGFYLCKGIPYFSIYNIMINTFFVFIAIFIYSIFQKIKL